MGENAIKFRTLRADEIDCRVGTCNEKGFTLLLYKDARCDMNILDETVGADKWQRRHYEVKGNMFCSVGIDCGNGFIFKDDCGTESNTEKEKGESSDSFKRACFNWGIGRELYTAPFIYIKGNAEKNDKGRCNPTFKRMSVSKIGYTDGRITALEITGDGEIIYEYGKKSGKAPEKSETKPKQTPTVQPKSEMTLEEAKKHTTKKGFPFDKLSDDYLQQIIDSNAGEDSKEAARLILLERDKELDDITPLDEGDLPF